MLTHPDVHNVVIVNGSIGVLELVERALDGGRYDVVFVESNDHAYSQIKRVHPNLVVLCLRIEDAAGFRVLSMLKLDRDTRDIPILTYTTEFEGQEDDDEALDRPGEEISRSMPALRMN